MWKNYFKVAWRNLWKNPVFSGINVLGLAIGLSACLVIFLLVRHEMSYDKFHQDGERIYRIVSEYTYADEVMKNNGVSGPLPAAVKQEISGLENVAAFHVFFVQQVQLLKEQGEIKTLDVRSNEYSPDNQNYIIADPQYFAVFSYEWLAGNPETSLQEPYKVVLTQQQAHNYFGKKEPEQYLGKTITYLDSRDTLTVTVSGLVRDWQQNTDFHFTDFISLATAGKSPKWQERLRLKEWGGTSSSSQLFVKLGPNTKPEQVAQQFPGLINRQIPKDEYNTNRAFLLQPLSDIHFNADYGGDYVRLAHRPTLYGLIGIGVFLLLIAAVNFINLATAQSVQRTKEIGVRKVLGGSRKSLIMQFLSETLVLTLAAVFFAILLTPSVLVFYESFLPSGIHLPLINPEVMLFLALITLVTTLLAGFYPALVLSAALPVQSLKGKTSVARKSGLRKMLIVFQFTVSQIFILGVMVVVAQINFLRSQDMGFRQEEIVTFRTDWHDMSNRKFVLLNKIRQMPGVAQVSLSNSTPASWGTNTTTLKYFDGKKEIQLNVHNKSGDENFIQLYDIKLLAGRNIRATDTLQEMLINETYAKALGFERPGEAVGENLVLGEQSLPIVGVTEDFHVHSLHTAIQPAMIGSGKKYASTISLKIPAGSLQSGEFRKTMAEIEKEFLSLYPGQKFSYTFFDETIAGFYNNEQKTASIVRLATILAVLIACLGLLGLVAFTVTRRTKEMGIRKVLGASVFSIVTLLSKDFLKLVLLANIIAWPLAGWAMHHWLQDFAFRIRISWWLFALAGGLAIFIALLTVGFQALKAARANPVKNLRTE